jgi:glycolate oxidase
MELSTSNKKLPTELIRQFKEIVGEEFIRMDEETLKDYGHDETENLLFLPDVVLRPGSAEDKSTIMKICNRERIPVTPRGAGTGLSGCTLPHLGGVLLSTDRLKRIIHIEERNLQVTTWPGVITEVFQDAVKEKGLFYPLIPAAGDPVLLAAILLKTVVVPKPLNMVW